MRHNQRDVAYNTRAKLIAKLTAQMADIADTLMAELNADSARPIHQVNDLAGKNVGAEYLLSAETCTPDVQWPVMLGRMLQDVRQLQRRTLRAEALARR